MGLGAGQGMAEAAGRRCSPGEAATSCWRVACVASWKEGRNRKCGGRGLGV